MSTTTVVAKIESLRQREAAIVAAIDGKPLGDEHWRQGIRVATDLRRQRMALEQQLRDR